MEIPMADIINSYRQQLSDALHKVTLLQLQVKALEKEKLEKDRELGNLQMQLDTCRLANEEIPQDDEWEESDVNTTERGPGDSNDGG